MPEYFYSVLQSQDSLQGLFKLFLQLCLYPFVLAGVLVAGVGANEVDALFTPMLFDLLMRLFSQGVTRPLVLPQLERPDVP